MLISHFSSASGGFAPGSTPLGDFRPPDSLARPHHVKPLHCKILSMPMIMTAGVTVQCWLTPMYRRFS